MEVFASFVFDTYYINAWNAELLSFPVCQLRLWMAPNHLHFRVVLWFGLFLRILQALCHWYMVLPTIKVFPTYFLHVPQTYLTIGHALWQKNWQKHSYLWFRAVRSLVFFHMVRAVAYWHKIHDIHTCAFAVQTKQSVLSLFFGGSCEDIVRLSI